MDRLSIGQFIAKRRQRAAFLRYIRVTFASVPRDWRDDTYPLKHGDQVMPPLRYAEVCEQAIASNGGSLEIWHLRDPDHVYER